MNFEPILIPGAFLITPNVFSDPRGQFVKSFHEGEFAAHGMAFRAAEEFYSVSQRGVLRGMHFQTPPAAHEKLVYCIKGRILDVIVDLRKGSPAFGKFYAVELNAAVPRSLFIPMGIAHGFLSLEDDSTMMYSVSTVHNPACDSGIRWDSFGMEWPCCEPVTSPRDSGFPTLGELDSPFVFKP
jgi:dTDP-4-dehydrorhamnose 3,5-epimerase